MARLFSKILKKPRRRDMPDGKSVALAEAGIRLLARKDYENLSMAQIARESGCAIGTLYERYSDKNAYLYRTIGHAFRYLAGDANRALDGSRVGNESGAAVVKRIVSHVTSQMTAPRAAGIIRASLKLSAVKPVASKPFEDYRKAVTERAVTLLTGRSRKISAGAVRIGMQIVLGTITDSIMQKNAGAMNAGSARMAAALSNVLLGYLGLEGKSAWSGREANGVDDPAAIPKLGSDTPPPLDEGEIAIFDPESRTYIGKRLGALKSDRIRSSTSAPSLPDPKSQPRLADKSTSKSKPIPKAAAFTPPRIPAKQPVPAAKPSGKRKHRTI